MKTFLIILRRIIALAFFAAFLLFEYKYVTDRTERIESIKRELQNNEEKNVVETTLIEESETKPVIIATESSTATEEDEQALDKFYKDFIKEVKEKKNADYFYKKNRNEIFKLLKGVRIIGDSNVGYLAWEYIVDQTYLGIMKGQSVTKQLPLIQEFITPDYDTYVLWNGYNIKYYASADEFVKAYDDLIAVIKSINPKAEVYVCSLLPASDEKVQQDLNSDFCHELYKGPEFDKALEEHFGDHYINTKTLLVDDFYRPGDGVHFTKTFNKMLVIKIAYYINDMKRKKAKAIGHDTYDRKASESILN